jgi:hypothetical protein
MGEQIPHHRVISALSQACGDSEIGEFEPQSPSESDLGVRQRFEVDPVDGEATFIRVKNGGVIIDSQARFRQLFKGLNILAEAASQDAGYPVYPIFEL